MNKTTNRRIALLLSLVAAAALSLSACGSVTLFGSGPDHSGATSSPSGETSAPAASSSQSGSATGPAGTASGSGGQSGLVGGSTSGSSGQVGVTGGGGVSGGTPGISTPATGLSPEEVAQYCKNFSNVLDPQYVSTGTAFAMIGDVRALRPHTPVQLLPDVDIILTDYKLVSDGSRIYSQVLGELNSAYKPLKDFSNQACA